MKKSMTRGYIKALLKHMENINAAAQKVIEINSREGNSKQKEIEAVLKEEMAKIRESELKVKTFEMAHKNVN